MRLFATLPSFGMTPLCNSLVTIAKYFSSLVLGEGSFQASYIPAQQVADNLTYGMIDAFFSVSGWPQKASAELANTVGIVPVLIDGQGVKTLNVDALWVNCTESQSGGLRAFRGSLRTARSNLRHSSSASETNLSIRTRRCRGEVMKP
jgi:hypothetical protein